MKIAVLYVCTGKYEIFWKDFFLSCEKFFIPEAQKHYFVFTDSSGIYKKDDERVSVTHQQNLGWPNNTLLRYEMFLNRREELLDFDYVFFFNANLLFLEKISAADFLPGPGQSFTACQHPGFYDKDPQSFPLEKDRKSRACVSNPYPQKYYQGAVNGGKAADFVQACEEMDGNIKADLRDGLVAIWHDESHWNAYVQKNAGRVRSLDPSYLFPEGSSLPFEPKILIRNKDQFGSLNSIRGISAFKINRRLVLSLFNKIRTKLIHLSFTVFDFFYTHSILSPVPKPLSADGRTVSVAITSYNRESLLPKALKNAVTDPRVSEVVILDDGSTEDSFARLKEMLPGYNVGNKIKLYRRKTNLGLLATKIEAVELCANETVVLLDSDNTLLPNYLDKLFSIPSWDPMTIYAPSAALPFFDFESMSGRLLMFSDMRSGLIFTSKKTGNFLNTCNYVVPRKNFVSILDPYRKLNAHAADSILMAYILLSNDMRFLLPKGMEYLHRVHRKSIWKETVGFSTPLFETVKNRFLRNEKASLISLSEDIERKYADQPVTECVKLKP